MIRKQLNCSQLTACQPASLRIETLEERNVVGTVVGYSPFLSASLIFGPTVLTARTTDVDVLLPQSLADADRSFSDGLNPDLTADMDLAFRNVLRAKAELGTELLTGFRAGPEAKIVGVGAVAFDQLAQAPINMDPRSVARVFAQHLPITNLAGLPERPSWLANENYSTRLIGAADPGYGVTDAFPTLRPVDQTLLYFTGASGRAVSRPPPPAGKAPPPIAGDDTLANNNAYIAYANSQFNVSADAGLLFNDTPLAGHLLTAVLDTPPAGTLSLNGDGSFSYVPPPSFVGIDTFTYHDVQDDAAVSNVATVEIRVSNDYVPQPFGPPTPFFGNTPEFWSKFHRDAINTGANGPRQPGPALNQLWSTSTGFPIQGSAVVGRFGFGNLHTAVYIENSSAIFALDGDMGGAQVWQNTITAITPVPGQKVYRAPLLIGNDPTPTSFTVVDGTYATGSLVALNGDTGALISSFRTQETFMGGLPTTLKPVASSPTFDTPHQRYVFGSDGAQNPGPSQGKIYALRPDGSVAWMTLLAGPVHGSPMLVEPHLPDFPDGAVYVGTLPNPWVGRPGQLGSTEGRFYKLNEATGAVLAEVFMPGDVVASATGFFPVASGDDPTVRIFITSTDGLIRAFSPVVIPPPPLMESRTLTPIWSFQGAINPTSPAIIGIAGFLAIYVGDNAGLRALRVADGTQVFYFIPDPPGQVVGDPAVARDSTTPSTLDVVFGTKSSIGKVYELDAVSGTPVPAPFMALDSFVSAPALGGLDMFNNTIYIGTLNGVVYALQ